MSPVRIGGAAPAAARATGVPGREHLDSGFPRLARDVPARPQLPGGDTAAIRRHEAQGRRELAERVRSSEWLWARKTRDHGEWALPQWAHSAAWYEGTQSEDREAWRAEIVASLERSPDPDLRRRAGRMRDCRTKSIFMASKSGKGAVAPRSCDDRLCPYCIAHRTRRIGRVLDWVLEQPNPKHMTLTVPHAKGEAFETVRERLIGAWRRFRRRDAFRDHVSGGVYKVETTYGANGFHVHLHVFAVASYWPADELHAEWSDVLGLQADPGRHASSDSIQAARGATELRTYALKVEVGRMPDEALWEWCVATQRRRDFATFGDLRCKDFDPPEPAEDDKLHPVKPGDVVTKAQDGDAWALGVAAAWRDAYVQAVGRAKEDREARARRRRRRRMAGKGRAKRHGPRAPTRARGSGGPAPA